MPALPPDVTLAQSSCLEYFLVGEDHCVPEIFTALLHELAPRQSVRLVTVREVQGRRWCRVGVQPALPEAVRN